MSLRACPSYFLAPLGRHPFFRPEFAMELPTGIFVRRQVYNSGSAFPEVSHDATLSCRLLRFALRTVAPSHTQLCGHAAASVAYHAHDQGNPDDGDSDAERGTGLHSHPLSHGREGFTLAGWRGLSERRGLAVDAGDVWPFGETGGSGPHQQRSHPR